MNKVFRKDRQNSISNHRVTKYVLYAIGEILLVVIGILIALQINNWNEHKKSLDFQTKILKEIKTSLEKDMGRTTGILEGRAKPKFQAIQELIETLVTAENAADSIIRKLYFDASMTLSFSYDKGAFESLKNRGFEHIRNEELRTEIIRFYEVALPLRIIFVDDDHEVYAEKRLATMNRIFDFEYRMKDGDWIVASEPNLAKWKESRELMEVLRIEQKVANNYIERLSRIIEQFEVMIRLIDDESNKISND